MDEKGFVSLAIEKKGKQFSVIPEERYLDKDGTEQLRWKPSERKYFDSLTEALAFVKVQEEGFIG